MKTKTMKTKTDSAASSGYLERIVRFFRRIKTKPTHHPEIPLGYMVLDGKIVGITVEHVQEGFRNCTTLTNLESIHMPDSITSVESRRAILANAEMDDEVRNEGI